MQPRQIVLQVLRPVVGSRKNDHSSRSLFVSFGIGVFSFHYLCAVLPLSFRSEGFSDVFTLARRPTRSWRSYRFGDGYEIVKVQESLSLVSTGKGENLRCLRKFFSHIWTKGSALYTHFGEFRKILFTTLPQPQEQKSELLFSKNFFHRTTTDPRGIEALMA